MTLPKASGAKNAVLNAPIAPEEMPITTRCDASSLHDAQARHVQRRLSHLELRGQGRLEQGEAHVMFGARLRTTGRISSRRKRP